MWLRRPGLEVKLTLDQLRDHVGRRIDHVLVRRLSLRRMHPYT